MPRVKLTLQYKGTNYHGWQVQPNGLSIQEVLEKTLSTILNRKIHVVAAGRTDAGVHALGQVCHFDCPVGAAPCGRPRKGNHGPFLKGNHGGLPLQKLIFGLNSLLPSDISVTSARLVPETFHAQKSAKKKIYDYYLFNSPIRSPFLTEYAWQIPYQLDGAPMKKAACLLVGEHDFGAFCASGSAVKTTVRRIYGIKIYVNTPIIKISLTGNGFLKQMVRNIVGTLVDVGKGKTTLTQFKKILKSKDRRKAGPTAPAKGLVLKDVFY